MKAEFWGLYFSAHWCPPCRGFTPKLAEWYTKLTGAALKDKLEIIFVSSDRDEDAFDEYFDSMPWLSLPYNERDIKASLSKKFKVSGIPTLVFVNAKTGELIEKSGRSVVTEDPNGENFPWKPETFGDVIPGVFVNKDGNKISWDDCKGKNYWTTPEKLLLIVGRGMVSSDPEGKDFPWYPKALEPLHSGKVDAINEQPCLIWFTDGTDAQIEKAKKSMDPVAHPILRNTKMTIVL
ncbi:LOW QUALITY PROTEIN: nucleoredoxin-like [Gigantopelta aegis]|uniref:LOW QUALITY PROTEIN: nucleoredoxin-like n=1 Tax=Gigantopelta aegis TaxID=1735272 RepID=UPI001B88D823|nr:LOW QUALITY PROTEIN: nucleoredoxin-like [Gigantopelta aegis]